MKDDAIYQLDELLAKIDILEQENLQLTEKSEDSLLTRLLLERISELNDTDAILDASLEQISILKNMPYCSCCIIKDESVIQRSVYASFTDADFHGTSLQMPHSCLDSSVSGACLQNLQVFSDLNRDFMDRMATFVPESLLVLRFHSKAIPDGLFLFLDDHHDDKRIESLSDHLQNLVYLIVEQIDKKHLEHNLDRLSKEFVEAEKQASLVHLVAGIAHEVNTPLGNALTAMSFLKDQLAGISDENLRNDLADVSRMVQDNLKESIRLIDEFKQVSVDTSGDDLVDFDLATLLRQGLVPRLKLRLPNDVQVISVNCPPVCRMRSYPDAVIRALTHLVSNAGMHGYGSEAPGEISIIVERKDEMVHLAVSDKGAGMDRAMLEKMYDPFVTGRRNQGHLGLGLTIVYNTVRSRLHGSISVDSTPGEGTTFTLTLPAVIEGIPSIP